MQQLNTDIAQSFWLRFWREPHQGQHREWRGTIWHEQQAEHEKPTPIANPDEAFEFVRRALRASGNAASGTAPDGMPLAATSTMPAAPRSTPRRVLDFWLAAIRREKREPKP